jgi:hypothetical protein
MEFAIIDTTFLVCRDRAGISLSQLDDSHVASFAGYATRSVPGIVRAIASCDNLMNCATLQRSSLRQG